MTDKNMDVSIWLPSGKYGIVMVDDSNLDNKINRNLIGYPLEGFGFSGLEMTKLRRPDFQEFSFYLNETNDKILIKVIYGIFL